MVGRKMKQGSKGRREKGQTPQLILGMWKSGTVIYPEQTQQYCKHAI